MEASVNRVISLSQFQGKVDVNISRFLNATPRGEAKSSHYYRKVTMASAERLANVLNGENVSRGTVRIAPKWVSIYYHIARPVYSWWKNGNN